MAAQAAPVGNFAVPQPPPRPGNLGAPRPAVTHADLQNMLAVAGQIQNIGQFHNFCTQTIRFDQLPAEAADQDGRTNYFERMCNTLLPHIAETQRVDIFDNE